MDYLSLSQDFQSLHEAYYSLKDGKVEGIMEEMFTAVEFIKRESKSELSIAQFFEDKHGFGAAIKEDGFNTDVLDCLSNVTKFVSDDIYLNKEKEAHKKKRVSIFKRACLSDALFSEQTQVESQLRNRVQGFLGAIYDGDKTSEKGEE